MSQKFNAAGIIYMMDQLKAGAPRAASMLAARLEAVADDVPQYVLDAAWAALGVAPAAPPAPKQKAPYAVGIPARSLEDAIRSAGGTFVEQKVNAPAPVAATINPSIRADAVAAARQFAAARRK